jgi:HEPN domain-containing protein
MAADEPDVRTLEVRGWLLRAGEDLRAGRHDLTASPPLLNDVAFHAQQCSEKAMKAFLVHREQAFRKTHNLTELGGAVARLEPALAELMRSASLMTEFAWRFRYPGDLATVSHADAVQALEIAERVLAAVFESLPSNCRPG